MSTPPPFLPSHVLVSRAASQLVLIDVQEKLAPWVWETERLLSNCLKLVQGAKLLQVPVVATEQYPQGLGPTLSTLAEFLPERLPKMRFSAAEVLNWPSAAAQPEGRHQVLLCGIEAHVCVLQTAFDLLAQGYEVFIVADAVSSRRELDWKIALERLQSGGATLVTTESVLFEWCETAATPEFKQLVPIIKPKT